MSEPVSITVSADYIADFPDLQIRLFIRNLVQYNSKGLSKYQFAKILHDEAELLGPEPEDEPVDEKLDGTTRT